MQTGRKISTCYRRHVPAWFVYILICLVTFRVTRLIIEDTFPPIGVPREWILNWWDPDQQDVRYVGLTGHWGALGRSLRYLFSCPWCMSVWVGAVVVYVFTFFVSVPLPFAAWIVSSAITGLIACVEDKLSS
jgi:hypothetical protein